MIKKIISILAVAILAACSLPENLGMPTWTTNLKLFILNDTYDISDLAEEDSTLVAFGDTLGFSETVNESGEISFSTEAVVDNQVTEIGDIEISNPDQVGTNVQLAEFAPNLVNGYIPAPGIAPFTLPEIVKNDVVPFGEFEQATFNSGILEITLTNNTVVWMGDINNANPLIVTIMNMNDDILFQHAFSEDIPPYAASVITEYENMAGVIMENDIKIELSGGSRGTDGQAATVDTTATLQVSVDIHDLVAEQVLAQIPTQDISDSSYVVLDEDITIYSALLADDGSYITIDIANSIDLEIAVAMTIDNVWLPGETDQFHFTFTIPASGGNGNVVNQTEVIALNNATIGDNTIALDSLKVVVAALTTDSGEEYREVNATDSFEISVTVSELEFAYVSGILQPQEQDIIEGESEIGTDYPYINGEFGFSGYSEIVLDLFTPVPAEIGVDIHSSNTNGEEVSLREYGSDEMPLFILPQGNSQIIISSEQYSINELISILPDSINYTIYPTVGDSSEIFVYNQGDSLTANIQINSRLDIVADCWLIPKDDDGNPDVQSVDVSEFKQKHLDAFKYAKLTLNYYNDLGLATGARLLISEQRTEDFATLVTPDTTQFTIINIPYLTQSTGTELDSIQVNIDQHDLEYFLADSVFIIPKILLYSEEGIPLAGSINMQASVEVEVEVNNELVQD
ncbi:MAG TPA: hypothetical protein PLD62_08905 [Candidatus Cloacimonadota bacterium]|nr:hypothetical protein [Candidatus Cloacimonadota bacterium]